MPVAANAQGVITGSFTVPADIPVGTKRIEAKGRGGTRAFTSFTGSGTIETQVLQRVFTTQIWREWRPPIIPVTDPGAPINDGGMGGGNDGGGNDPLAQTFTLTESRHITGVDVKFCQIGNPNNPVFMQIRRVQLGIPTQVVLAEAMIDMTAVTVGQWKKVALRFPVFLQAGVEVAMVFLSDDNEHSMSLAELGAFDAQKQQFVTANPYSIGVLLSGSNNSTWTPHQGADLAFRLYAAKFTANERLVDFGNFTLNNVTDLLIFAGVQTPTPGVSVMAIVTRASNGEVIRVQPGQPLKFDTKVTDTVNLKFELKGNALHSPVLFPFVQMIKGSQADSAQYVTRAVNAGQSSRILVTFDCITPGIGSNLVVEIGRDGAWTQVALKDATPLGDGWQERTYELVGYNLSDVRTRITLNGTPAARPIVRDLRMIVTAAPLNITA
jgi:hypothetical protein